MLGELCSFGVRVRKTEPTHSIGCKVSLSAVAPEELHTVSLAVVAVQDRDAALDATLPPDLIRQRPSRLHFLHQTIRTAVVYLLM